MTIEILHLQYQPGCLAPAEVGSTCARSEDLAYCRLGTRETELTIINSTHASCLVPPQSAPMLAPVALRTLGGEYFGEKAELEAAKLRYFEGTGITNVIPKEGPAEGGQLAVLSGDYSLIPETDTLTVKFGGVPVDAVVSRTDANVTVRVGAVTLGPGEVSRTVNITVQWEQTGLLFLNDSARYTFRTYPTVDSIWPEHGPAGGGTLIEVHGDGLDQKGQCILTSSNSETEKI